MIRGVRVIYNINTVTSAHDIGAKATIVVIRGVRF